MLPDFRRHPLATAEWTRSGDSAVRQVVVAFLFSSAVGMIVGYFRRDRRRISIRSRRCGTSEEQHHDTGNFG